MSSELPADSSSSLGVPVSSLPFIAYSSSSSLPSSELAPILARLDSQGEPEKPFWFDKYQRENVKNWDKFYKRNENRFFKDRHYLGSEFDELRAAIAESVGDDRNRKIFFEIGCGVGNALFPLVDSFPEFDFLGCDCSHNAIQVLRSNSNY